ncbi:hypothetical protein Hanom_Chr03g00228621 [Helianthus anomalus]
MTQLDILNYIAPSIGKTITTIDLFDLQSPPVPSICRYNHWAFSDFVLQMPADNIRWQWLQYNVNIL